MSCSSVDPKVRVAAALAFCCMNPGKPIYWLADLNGRTQSLQTASEVELPRSSMDLAVPNGRGRWILDSAFLNKMWIINGTELEEMNGAYTSYQPGGSVIVDYAVVSQSVAQQCRLSILGPYPSGWSDHASLHLTV
ncbi:hypothetical protein C8J56DRAFT_786228, partial [Mycena floridula]